MHEMPRMSAWKPFGTVPPNRKPPGEVPVPHQPGGAVGGQRWRSVTLEIDGEGTFIKDWEMDPFLQYILAEGPREILNVNSGAKCTV